jgi:hypothetical protein
MNYMHRYLNNFYCLSVSSVVSYVFDSYSCDVVLGTNLEYL